MPFVTRYKLKDLLQEDNADGVVILSKILDRFEIDKVIEPNAEVVMYYRQQQKQVVLNSDRETISHWRRAHYLSFVTKELHKKYTKLYPDIVKLDLVKIDALLANKVNKILKILSRKHLLKAMDKEEILTLLIRVFLGDPEQHGKCTKLRKEVARLLD